MIRAIRADKRMHSQKITPGAQPPGRATIRLGRRDIINLPESDTRFGPFTFRQWHAHLQELYQHELKTNGEFISRFKGESLDSFMQ